MATSTIEKLESGLAKALDEGKLEMIKKYRRELGETLADGAKNCPNCGYPPVGMIKTPSYMDRGVERPAVIEVGCVFCPPYYVTAEDGQEAVLDGKKAKVKRRSYSARAMSQSDAVKRWNEGLWVEDFNFGQNITPDEQARLG